MSKLNALKEKLHGLLAQLREKTDKIAFLKAWRERRTKAAASGPGPQDNLKLSAIYRDGSTGTRLQVLAFYLFIVVAVVSAASVVRKLAVKLRSSSEHEKLVGDISHGIAENKRKNEEKAEMLALGQFTANVFTGESEKKMMSIELWIRVSDPEAAATVNHRTEVFREKTMDALNDLFVNKVRILDDAGKRAARDRIRASLNTALKSGRVEDVFIQNLVIQ